jgi:hypothetical protein
MSASGNIINYNIRTCKSVERRMILSTVSELLKTVPFNQRRYIGFGSTYFSDFKLFHKELHIENMISFEMEASLQKRVEFNKPFKCINARIGKSTDLLQDIVWSLNIKDIIWMDYDNQLDYDMFNDVEHIFSNISAGSIYLMTCNKQLKNYDSIESFNEVFGEVVPIDISIKDFSGERDYLLIRKMFLNKIEQVLRGRNQALQPEEQFIFNPLFFFTYRDGAPMISFGGFLSIRSQNFNLSQCNLDHFEFIKTGIDRYIIDPPTISIKETYLLNSHLPNSDEGFTNEEQLDFIPVTDRNKYRKLYKYLPSYMDVLT